MGLANEHEMGSASVMFCYTFNSNKTGAAMSWNVGYQNSIILGKVPVFYCLMKKFKSQNSLKKEPFFPSLWGYWITLTIYFKIDPGFLSESPATLLLGIILFFLLSSLISKSFDKL